jgi:hypothetical protein
MMQPSTEDSHSGLAVEVNSHDMKDGRLAKAWHDPVWSKVISWAITAVLAVLALWAWSGFSAHLTVIWASTVSIWTWLSSPTYIPLGIEWLTLITFAVLYWWLIVQQRRAIKELADRHVKLMLDAADDRVRGIQQLEEKLRASELEKDRVKLLLDTHQQQLASQPAPLDMEDKSIKQILTHLSNAYPSGRTARAIQGQIFQTPLATEQFLDRLAAHDLVKFVVAAPYGGSESVWVLTKKGRDY